MSNTPSGNSQYDSRITRMEAHMQFILGEYGQPGKLKDIETMIAKHGEKIQRQEDRLNKLFWVGLGVLAALQILQANGLLSFSKIFGH